MKKTMDSDYKNPLGYVSPEFLLQLHNNQEVRVEFHKRFRITENPCPPLNLRTNDIVCFHCKECYDHAIEKAYERDKKKRKKEQKEGVDSNLV